MKVLYIGYYKDGSGWAQAAQDWILALDAAGVDVVPRAYKLNNFNGSIPERIIELEKKSDRNCTHVIQHLLPHHMDFDGNFDRTIGLFFTETSHFSNTSWPNKLNLMDEIWVTNKQMLKACDNSGVNRPIYVVPYASNVSKFLESHKNFELPKELDGNFLFYFIGEMNRRKNLGALIKAFHIEFDAGDPVSLVIKSGIPGASPDESFAYISKFCKDVKHGLKIYNSILDYKQE